MKNLFSTILIVEDHASLRVTLRRWLETKIPNCEVITATKPQEIPDLVKSSNPQIIILDIGPPGMNGIEAVKHVKQCIPSAPIVVLTSYDNETGRTRAQANGASAYIDKRAMLTELQPTLLRLLSSNRSRML